MRMFELTRKDGKRFMYDFDSDWEIFDTGPDTPALWSNWKQARNLDCREAYTELRAKFLPKTEETT